MEYGVSSRGCPTNAVAVAAVFPTQADPNNLDVFVGPQSPVLQSWLPSTHVWTSVTAPPMPPASLCPGNTGSP